MRNFLTTIIVILFVVSGLGRPFEAVGMMTSSQYTIYADSIDTGGIFSSGGIYELEDTIGESPVGSVTGGAYEVRGGYQYMSSSTLSILISASSVNLSVLNPTVVRTANSVVTVSTVSDSGYTLSIGGVSGTSMTAVADGAVTVGSAEYGMAASGADSLIVGDVAVTAPLSLASAATPVLNRQTTLTFKASMAWNTALNAAYTQNIVLVASANF